MFQRFHALKERKEGGFTLIELLVVVLIIAILAAIAIPVFLNQRRKAWRSQIQSDLKNAAIALEDCSVDANGLYNGDPAGNATAGTCDSEGGGTATVLDADFGFNRSEGVTIVAVKTTAAGDKYCIEATHASLGNDIWRQAIYDVDNGRPTSDDTCPPAYS
jgi:type IV pilus assembly protein PilA